MRIILSIILLVLTSMVSNAQNDRPNAPVFKFVEETHNFGNIKEGPEAIYNFEFTNTGKEPLIIQDCKASCGCTTPDWSRAPVLPGQKGNITVKYDTKGRVGTFNKSIFIASNAKTKGSEKRYEIIITGNVIGTSTTTTDTHPSPKK